MESTLSLQKEVSLLETIAGINPSVEHPSLDKQITYLFSLFQNSMNAESWNQNKIQPVLMRLLLLLDQKAFAQQYPNVADYNNKLANVYTEFINKSSLFSTFGKQLNLFFSKKKFSKFPNSVKLLGTQAKFIEIFRTSIEKEIEKDIESLEKDTIILSPGAFLFISEDFICRNLIPFFGKILRKSMKNLSKIRAWLSNLPKISGAWNCSVLANLILFLGSNLCDALNKDEPLQKEVFVISQNLLQSFAKYSHMNEKFQNAIAKFLTSMTSKLKSKRNDYLMLNFVQTLLSVEGKQNAKVVKLVVDGFWIALANTKDENVSLEIKTLFIGIRKIDNLPELLKNLSLKMKVKKDLLIVSPLINNILKGFDFLKIKLSKKNNKCIVRYNQQDFNSDSPLEFAHYVHWQLTQLISILGQKSSSMICFVPETASANLMNFLCYIYNSYFALISKIKLSLVTADSLEELKEIKSKEEIIKRFFDWRQRALNAPELKAKIICLLFKSNSIIFRKSLAESLEANDCRMMLNLFKMLGTALITHVQKKKLENTMSLLIYELVSKVLQSPEGSEAYVFGKYAKLARSCEKNNQWVLFSVLRGTMENGFLFNELLINEFTCELLLNGMFIQMVGGRYSLRTLQKINKIFSFLKYEKIDIFQIARSPKLKRSDSLTIGFKLICLLSLNEFDNLSCSNSLGWGSIIGSADPVSNHSQIFPLMNNFSQMCKVDNALGSLQVGDLKTILGDNEDQIDDFFERVLSDQGLFSRNFTVRKFCGRLLAILTLNESKSIFHRLNWMLSVNNLQKLSRMNKIIKHIEMEDLELEKEELSQPEYFSERLAFLLGSFTSATKFTDYLRDYGYNDAEDVCGSLPVKGFPGHSEFTEERTGLFELCSELNRIEENEDEHMAELELNSQKDTILSKFCFYIESLSLALFELLQLCGSVDREEEKNIAQHSIVLLNSVQINIDDQKSYMRRNLRILFLNVYFLASRQNKVNELIEFFYHIKTRRDDSSFIRSIERKCEGIANKPEYYSEHLFEMFFEILNFLVVEKLSAKAKKNILIIVVGFLEKFPSFEKKIFKYLVESVNSFYFDFAFEKISVILNKLYTEKGK